MAIDSKFSTLLIVDGMHYLDDHNGAIVQKCRPSVEEEGLYILASRYKKTIITPNKYAEYYKYRPVIWFDCVINNVEPVNLVRRYNRYAQKMNLALYNFNQYISIPTTVGESIVALVEKSSCQHVANALGGRCTGYEFHGD